MDIIVMFWFWFEAGRPGPSPVVTSVVYQQDMDKK